MIKYKHLLSAALVLLLISVGFSQELPRPDYDNSLIFAITYSLGGSSSEIEYIKSQFGNGLYAPLYFSHFLGINMDWGADPSEAEDNIDSFKSKVENLLDLAENYDIGLHIIVSYGLARNRNSYEAAKAEDIRNAQWYNDNNLAASDQLVSEMNDNVFGTLSRYARKQREFHEAKIAAMMSFLKQKQDENPGIPIVFSGPGEVELNYFRINHQSRLQDFFCDYSPFSVLEFRDWIRHTGLYAAGARYDGEGYSGGGSRYQGSSGLQNFNADFGTGFSSWDLKYYNWSLNDPLTAGAMPFAGYSFGGQMPNSGPGYISGGFDPPRLMLQKGTNAYWDLWHSFRELLVAHYVKDMTDIARSSGFPKKQVYTHQIPADYLFGSKPSDLWLNPRYYSSASPMWTADAFSDCGMAITLYDLKIDESTFWRTSLYSVPAIDAMSSNWAALEYNPEVHPWEGIPLSSVQDLYEQMIRLYQYNIHVLSLFMWETTYQYTYKNTNREIAAKQMFDNVKDCARQPVGTLFSPPAVPWFEGEFNETSGTIDLAWSQEIWSGLSHQWDLWGGFKEFVIYRGYTPDFSCNPSSEIARTTDFSYVDSSFSPGMPVYYKIAAVNTTNVIGPLVSCGPIVTVSGPISILDVSRSSLIFAGISGGIFTSPQQLMVLNQGTATMTWSVVPSTGWLNCTPSFGTDSQVLTVSINPAGLSAGNYNGNLIISADGAYGSPQSVSVTLKVTNPGETLPPIGYWDTPIDGATQVRGQVPVTGWALDDIEVDRVEIWRSPEPEDSPGAIGPDGLVYVGKALFVEGARTNLETDPLYNWYPYNYKGGWGYMMLTYGLPRRGNGSYLLYAFAWDVEGHKTSLGTKAITCDNVNAVKPFGTLDTPEAGMIFPHDFYDNINFGWVLTPQPKIIPFDGSSIYVFIDGVLKGNVDQYGNYSATVAAMFPGYANTNNSYGHYFIDLESYENGVHTIQWSAYDSDGVGAGIGSRYFSIQNTIAAPQSNMNTLGYFQSLSDLSPGFASCSMPLLVKEGYDLEIDPEVLFPDREGVVKIEMKEVERIEIELPQQPERQIQKVGKIGKQVSKWNGFLVVGDKLHPLPIGSTFNPERNVFYWQPGAGFLGEYDFVFFHMTQQTIRSIIRFQIKIVPKNAQQRNNSSDT